MTTSKTAADPAEGRIRFTGAGRARSAAGGASAATRTALIDVTEKLLLEEGFPALSSRRIGKEAGVKPTIIYYYFRTIEDLYLAVFQRVCARDLARLRVALESDQPLSALWRANRDRYTRIGAEFRALANHCPPIQAAVAAHAEAVRAVQVEALADYFRRRGMEPAMPLPALVILLTGAATVISVEARLGFAADHAETGDWIEAWLAKLEAGDTGFRPCPTARDQNE
jgi:AcrR family transcriptional regulator